MNQSFMNNRSGNFCYFKLAGLLLSMCLVLTFSSTTYGQNSKGLSPSWAQDPPDMNTLISFAKQQSEMRTVVNRYTEDLASLQRRYPVPYSAARRARLSMFFNGWKKSMNNLNFNSLSQEGKVDFILLNQTLDFELHKLILEEKNWTDFVKMVPFGDSLSILQENRFDKKTLNPRATAGMLDGVTDQIDSLIDGLKQKAKQGNGIAKLPGISQAVASRAADYLGRLGIVLDDWNKFYDGYDPLYNFWVRETYTRLVKSLNEYKNTIVRNVVGVTPGDPGVIIGDPVLEEGLKADLTHEMIPYNAKELIAIGEREFKWTVDRFKEVSQKMGYGDDWKKALEYVKTLAPPPGYVMDSLYAIADYSFNYIEDMNYVTIPSMELEVWRMEMQTPERQLSNPFFTGGETTRASYPTDGMEFKTKMMSMRGNTPSFNFPTVQHELIPGHYQQGFIRSRFNVERSKLSGTPFWGEGNAFYWELVLWDKGNFARSNEDKIGMLFWKLHRAARIIFSLNFQLGKWSAQECVDFLVDKVGHERANAEGEVRRSVMGSTPPLYQIAYAIGAFQHRALYKEVVESKKMTPKEFHDAILIGGSMPIEMVRARILNLPLTKNYKSNWRWEGDVL